MTDRVIMRLRGRMLERFVGRALQEGIRFQTIERIGAREIRMCAAERYARRIQEMAEQYGLELSVEGHAGRPAFKQRVMERRTLPLGLILSLMLITSFTARFWRVEAVSLDGAADAAMLQAICQSASGLGVHPGMLRRDIDRDALAMQIHALWPELTHVSIRMDGIYLRVEVAAEETEPEVYEIAAGRDLAAVRDAIVVYVEPLAGKACVKAGDTVRKGQVLIRGEERIDTEATRRIRAQGKVIGRVWFTAECKAPTAEMVSERTGRKRMSACIRLGGWEWMLTNCEEFASQQTETELLPIGGLYLPLRIERTVLWETVQKRVFREMNMLREKTAACALEEARSRLPDGAQETVSWVDFSEKDGILTARATIEAEMDIAAEIGRIID